MTIPEIIVSVLVLIAAALVATNAIGVWRGPDALTRANVLGTTVSTAFPLLIVAKLIRDWSTQGFNPNDFIRALIAIAGVWIVASVGTFVMGRTLYGVTVTDPPAAAK